MNCTCEMKIDAINTLCDSCKHDFNKYLDDLKSEELLTEFDFKGDYMKLMTEINLPILGQTNQVIGTYSRRFNTRSEAKRQIFKLEADGMKFKDPFNEEYWSTVETPDLDSLQ